MGESKGNTTTLRSKNEQVFTSSMLFLESPVRFPEKTGLPLQSLDILGTVCLLLVIFFLHEFFEFWPMEGTTVR